MAAGTSPSFCWIVLYVCLFGFTCAEQKNITAESGQNVTLTCRATNNNIVAIKWSRAELRTDYVLLYRDEQLVPDEQHPSFKNWVDLQDRQMKDGDVSLILRNVTTADVGTYECRFFTREARAGIPISISTLSVVPPPGPGNSEDGGKQVGVSRGRYGSAASGLLLLAVIFVAAVISKKHKKAPPPPDEEAKKELV